MLITAQIKQLVLPLPSYVIYSDHVTISSGMSAVKLINLKTLPGSQLTAVYRRVFRGRWGMGTLPIKPGKLVKHSLFIIIDALVIVENNK